MASKLKETQLRRKEQYERKLKNRLALLSERKIDPAGVNKDPLVKNLRANIEATDARLKAIAKIEQRTVFVVSYSLSGSATLGADYAAVTAGAPVPMGQSSVDVTVTPIDDSLAEGEETVQLTLVPGEGYALGVPSTAIMAIADNDGAPPSQPGTIQLSASTYQGAEGQGSVQVTATRTGGTSGQVAVSYNTGPSNATPGQDYTPFNGTLAWGSGDATAKTFTVPIVDDTLVEGAESFLADFGQGFFELTLYRPFARLPLTYEKIRAVVSKSQLVTCHYQ